MAFKSILLSAFLFSLFFCLVLAQDKPCSGYDVKFEYIRNCPEPKNQVIKIENLSVTLTEDCKLIPRGCFKVKKPIAGGKINYVVSKPPFKKSGSEDICPSLENPDTQKYLEGYKSLPRKCTISAGEYCINKGGTEIERLNSKILALLSGTTTGTLTVEVEGTQDVGCAEFKLVVTRKT